jgi:hypothetical protein
MFNHFKIKKLEATVADYEHENNCLKNRVIQLKEQIKQMELEKVDAIKTDVNSSAFEINWDKMDAFSIERMGDHNSAYTVIGHHMTDEHNVKHIHEWKFYCSQEQHNKLAQEFKYGTAKKNNSPVRERSRSKRARK